MAIGSVKMTGNTLQKAYFNIKPKAPRIIIHFVHLVEYIPVKSIPMYFIGRVEYSTLDYLAGDRNPKTMLKSNGFKISYRKNSITFYIIHMKQWPV